MVKGETAQRTYGQIYHETDVDAIIDEFGGDIRRIAEELLHDRRCADIRIGITNSLNEQLVEAKRQLGDCRRYLELD